LGRHGRRCERERREAEAREHAHLLLHDELLREALGRFRCDTRVVLDDEIDLAACDRVAILLHVEPARGLELLAGRGERTGQRNDEADLERLAGGERRLDERRRQRRGGRPEHCATAHCNTVRHRLLPSRVMRAQYRAFGRVAAVRSR
jgi:hypothetical protein